MMMLKPCHLKVNRSTQKGGIQRIKWKDKKTKEPPKRANHKGNIKFLNPLLSKEVYKIGKGGPSEKRPSLEEPSPTTIVLFKIEIACAHCNTIDTLCL
jgi:hypothetical protein